MAVLRNITVIKVFPFSLQFSKIIRSYLREISVKQVSLHLSIYHFRSVGNLGIFPTQILPPYVLRSNSHTLQCLYPWELYPKLYIMKMMDCFFFLSQVLQIECGFQFCLCYMGLLKMQAHWSNESFIFRWFSYKLLSNKAELGNHPLPCLLFYCFLF